MQTVVEHVGEADDQNKHQQEGGDEEKITRQRSPAPGPEGSQRFRSVEDMPDYWIFVWSLFDGQFFSTFQLYKAWFLL